MDEQRKFIDKAIKIHGTEYDYAKTIYIASAKKITITCKSHGDFEQRASNHLQGGGCQKCGKEKLRNTAANFVEKSQKIHPGKYDYSRANYINSRTKLIIICKQHGEFEQSPGKHILGRGCPKCGGSSKLTQEEFIKKSNTIHENKYDYSKIGYTNMRTKIIIICKKHGEFEQSPGKHVSGQGCPKCGGSSKLTQEEFIKKSNAIHENKYDYSKIKYTNLETKVIIICKKHGEFEQSPEKHVLGQGCPECVGRKKKFENNIDLNESQIKRDHLQSIKTEKYAKDLALSVTHLDHLQSIKTEKYAKNDFNAAVFVEKANRIHKSEYDYSKINFVDRITEIMITCQKHGEFFRSPFEHLKGLGCPKCAPKKLTTEQFIERSTETHDRKYDYSKVQYKNANTKVIIICKQHGEFEQKPRSHLHQNKGCQSCSPTKRITPKIFIERATDLNGDRYDYSQVKYVDYRTRITIICRKHGEFTQIPEEHLRGSNCPECCGKKKFDIGRFICLAKILHENKYDYSKVSFINYNTAVIILCDIHGEFSQKPCNHLWGSGCPSCGGSKKTINKRIHRKSKKNSW